jgi:acyl-CoA synthetase (AMP-forming)/AMP-acid ligase II
MLSQLVFDSLTSDFQPAVVTPAGSTTWGALREQACAILERGKDLGSRRIGLLLRPQASSYAAMAALDKLSCDVFLFDGRLTAQQANALAEKLKLGAWIDLGRCTNEDLEVHQLPNEGAWSGESTLTILTSGSTGEPKAARHTWSSLSRPVRKAIAEEQPTWFLTYRPQLYAGLQVMLQCFSDHGTLVVPTADMEPTSIAQFMVDSRVQFVSATPSYWRRMVMFAAPQVLGRIPLVQVTLGGEVVDQSILDSLRRHFPKARIVHIYATTELGKCFSVSDGLAGFPSSYLDAPLHDGCALRVIDGELFVSSPNSMRMYDPLVSQLLTAPKWFPTGDLIELRLGRVHFAGRKSEIINVAGSKVHPVEVERVIRAVPGVSDVRVFGKASSIAGELVACEIVAEKDDDQDSIKRSVMEACRSALASYQIPRLIKFVHAIDLSSAGKTLRCTIG